MSPRKRRSTKKVLEEKPEITIDLSEEEIEEKPAEFDKAEELSRTIRQIIGSPEKEEYTSEKPDEDEEKEAGEKERGKEDEAIYGEKIKQKIEKVKTKEGIIGYILRNSASASIDLKDPTKIVDFAILSSSAFETGEEFSKTFELGEVKNVFVEGNKIKFVSFTTEGIKVTVFMNKNVNHDHILKDLLS